MGLFKRRSKDLFTIPDPGPAPDTALDTTPVSGFRMAVADVFDIANRGTVATGTVEAGAIAVGTRVTIERSGRPPLAAEIAGIETARKTTRQAGTGDNVGLLFRGLTRGEIATGDVVRTS